MALEGEITGEDGKAKGVSFPAGRGRREQDTAAGQRTADAGGSVGAAQPQRQGHERADAQAWQHGRPGAEEQCGAGAAGSCHPDDRFFFGSSPGAAAASLALSRWWLPWGTPPP